MLHIRHLCRSRLEQSGFLTPQGRDRICPQSGQTFAGFGFIHGPASAQRFGAHVGIPEAPIAIGHLRLRQPIRRVLMIELPGRALFCGRFVDPEDFLPGPLRHLRVSCLRALRPGGAQDLRGFGHIPSCQRSLRLLCRFDVDRDPGGPLFCRQQSGGAIRHGTHERE